MCNFELSDWLICKSFLYIFIIIFLAIVTTDTAVPLLVLKIQARVLKKLFPIPLAVQDVEYVGRSNCSPVLGTRKAATVNIVAAKPKGVLQQGYRVIGLIMTIFLRLDCRPVNLIVEKIARKRVSLQERSSNEVRLDPSRITGETVESNNFLLCTGTTGAWLLVQGIRIYVCHRYQRRGFDWSRIG